ncbi:conserved hypothetical protein [Theileria orientalis strain Shintoku]|uniref:Sugar phosphate transporter domain-containing protein n=1 Tax=Theileria orientalis strain Shintoku TaxID=869250 RepID=J4C7J9_THEOR|nr:conserved hypothetical protein [Theileria orientalis strain Shintoku]BAM39168.1 conserved hypothetical protein [Theileria orientalis strain Shintoku]|eukprot:XP_009689469.1 conserved hypothetical protein [Theileria orientalis strain Shintoku]
MVLKSNLMKGFRHTYTVCILLGIVSVTCNISGINRIVKTSNVKTITPIVCNLESHSFVPNGVKLGFINNAPRYGKYKHKSSNFVKYEEGEELRESSRHADLSHRFETSLGAKPNANEVAHGKAPSRDGNRSLVFSRVLGSPLSSLREALSRVTKRHVFKAAGNLFLLVSNYVSTAGYKYEFIELLGLVPLRRTAAALQLLASLPITTCFWLLRLLPTPSFNVPAYQVEKVDFSRDGLLRSVKRSLVNGYNRTRAYVRAYRTVIVQGGCLSAMHYLSTTWAYMSPETGFLRAFEPLFVSLLTYLLGGGKFDGLEFVSLLPVVAGMLYSHYSKSLSAPRLHQTLNSPRTLMGCGAVLLYNLVSALQKVESSSFFKENVDRLGRNITPANVNAAAHVVGALMFVPFALSESQYWRDVYQHVFKRISGSTLGLLNHLARSGVYLGASNLTSFELTSGLSPVGKSLVNSLKITLLGSLDACLSAQKLHKQHLLGSLSAIAGALAYSLFKD